MTDTELILIELRELRSAFSENSIATGERLSSLETKMDSLIGNGKPGRITNLEDDVQELQRSHWKAIGVLTCLGFLGSFLGWCAVHFLPLLPF